MRSDFHERRARLHDRYRELAVKNTTEAARRNKAAKEISDGIPFGQPILVGHHSEGRHRRDLARINSNYDKGAEAAAKAGHYAGKAHNIEAGTAIFSDDPDAAELLREKIAKLEAQRVYMKAANRAARAAYKKGIREDGTAEDIAILIAALDKATGWEHSEALARAILTPDFCTRRGFAGYELTNNNANIKRNKTRLANLEAEADAETKEYMIGDATIVESVEDNRLQVFFPGKPAPEIRTAMKRLGFRWAPSVGAWQRHLNNAARHAVTAALPAAE